MRISLPGFSHQSQPAASGTTAIYPKFMTSIPQIFAVSSRLNSVRNGPSPARNLRRRRAPITHQSFSVRKPEPVAAPSAYRVPDITNEYVPSASKHYTPRRSPKQNLSHLLVLYLSVPSCQSKTYKSSLKISAPFLQSSKTASFPGYALRLYNSF